jgi:hypothetical protein
VIASEIFSTGTNRILVHLISHEQLNLNRTNSTTEM